MRPRYLRRRLREAVQTLQTLVESGAEEEKGTPTAFNSPEQEGIEDEEKESKRRKLDEWATEEARKNAAKPKNPNFVPVAGDWREKVARNQAKEQCLVVGDDEVLNVVVSP